MTSWKRWWIGARPKTLPAAVVPVAVGTLSAAVAADDGFGALVGWRIAAAALVAVALQVATNYVNDRSDGIRGTDGEDRVGPMRLVGSGAATPKEVGVAALAAGAVAGVAGGALALAVGPELFVLGAACLVAGWAYTGGPKPYAYLGLGEVFVFVFFGVVATVGSAYVHLGRIDGVSSLLSVAVGALATALLVTNNLRDIPGDTLSGKQTLAVRIGDGSTRQLFVALLALAFVIVLVAAATVSAWLLLALFGVLAAAAPVRSVLGGAAGADLIPVLGATAKLQMAVGVLLCVGLALAV